MLIQQIRYLPITTLHYIHVKIISKKSQHCHMYLYNDLQY